MEIEWEYVHGIHKQQRDLYIYIYIIWLVVDLPFSTPLKNMSSSVGMMKFPINMGSHNPFMFQTTNQIHICYTHHINPNKIPISDSFSPWTSPRNMWLCLEISIPLNGNFEEATSGISGIPMKHNGRFYGMGSIYQLVQDIPSTVCLMDFASLPSSIFFSEG